MNITLYGPYGWWSPHFETELELMELHLEKGDAVTYITCDAALCFCEINPKHDYLQCIGCFGRAREGIKRLSRSVKVVRLSELIFQARREMAALQKLPKTFSSFDELYNLRFENFDIGAAVLSTLNTKLNDPEPDPSRHPELTWSILSSAFAAFVALDRYLCRKTCDVFYLFNGRFSNFRAALRACNKRHVRCLVHERGCDRSSYSLAENTMPHDPSNQKKSISAALARAKSPEQKKALAQQFYAERKEGKIANWVSYTERQVRDSLPGSWLIAPVRIAAFSSTESEYACLREFYRPGIYPSQAEGFETIIHDLAERNFTGVFAIRMHPNSAGTKADFTDKIRALPYPFLCVIGPEEEIDSYALLKTAHKVLSFGSTIGIEAAYWGVPSIVARWAAYEDLGSTYSPVDHQQLMDLLMNPIDPKPTEGAIDFGFYSKNYGIRMRYITPIDAFSCKFKGAEVHCAQPYRNLWVELPKPSRARWRHWLEGRERKRQRALYQGRRFFLDPIRLMAAWEPKGPTP